MTFNNIIKPILISLATSLILLADENTPTGTHYTYKQSDGVKQEIEIHFPKDHDPKTSKKPAIIMFHGGAWVKGDKNQFRYLCHYFASRGIVAATANYRFAKKNSKDSVKSSAKKSNKRICITDAKSAIRWYKKNAEMLGIDPERIIVGGGSAGGHICLLATNNPGLNDPQDPLEYNTNAAAYLLFNPAFSASDKQDSEVNFLSHLKPNFPPTIVFYGTKDRWIKGWKPVYKKMNKMKLPYIDYWLANDQEHSFFNQQPWADVTLIACDKFLIKHGFLVTEPTLEAPKSGKNMVKVP